MKKDVQLNFGKYRGQNLSQTPKDYQAWLRNQVWFRVKFLETGETLEERPLKDQLSSKGKGLLRDWLKK